MLSIPALNCRHPTSSPPQNQVQDVPLLWLKFLPLSPSLSNQDPEGGNHLQLYLPSRASQKICTVSCPLLPTLPKIKWVVCTIPANIYLSVVYYLPPHTRTRTQFKMLLQTSPPHTHLSTTLTLSNETTTHLSAR